MKHSIVRWGLVFSLLLTLVTVSAGAAFTMPEAPTMPVDAPTCAHNSTEEHSTANGWTAITATSGSLKLDAGKKYYLTNNFAATAAATTGMIDCADGVTLCLNGKSITSSGVVKQLIACAAGGKVTICDCKGQGTITHRPVTTDYADNGVGVFYLAAGADLDVFDVDITNSNSGFVLRTITNASTNIADVNFVNVDIIGHKGVYNGGIRTPIYVGAYANVDCYNVNVTNTSYSMAPASGKTYVQYGGIASVLANGTLNIKNTTFSGLTVTNTGAGGTCVYGGAVCVDGGTFNMFEGSRIENITAFMGGGVYIKKNTTVAGTFNMVDGAIGSETAPVIGTNNAGGVLVEDSTKTTVINTFNMYGGTISYCQGQSGGGGGVYVNGANTKFNLKDGTISYNRATGANGSGVSHGAGVRVIGGTFNMLGGEISNNTVGNQGGGIHSTGTVTMSGGTIKNNSVTTGGGVWSSGTFTMEAAADGSFGTIENNAASSSGGGVYINAGTATVSAGTISGNNGKGSGGGGVYVNAGKFTLSGTGKVSGNKAETDTGSYANGPGVRVNTGATFEMTGGEISGQTRGNRGGGVYNVGTFTMKGGEIKNNNVPVEGAGVYSSGTFKMQAANDNSYGTISGNVTAGKGGGVYIGGGTATVEAGEIKDGRASAGGGGAYIAAGKLILSGGEISGNESTYGGGVYSLGEFELSGSGTITGNTAASSAGLGGGVYVGTTGKLSMSGGSVTSNSSKNAGGIYVLSTTEGNATISNGTISGNIATGGNGGAVFVAPNAYFALTNGTISGNYASNIGAGMIVDYDATFNMSNGSIINNKCATVAEDGTETIGSANGAGVAVYGTATISNGTISGNTTKGSFGVDIFVSSKTVTNADSSKTGKVGKLTVAGGTIGNGTDAGKNNSGSFAGNLAAYASETGHVIEVDISGGTVHSIKAGKLGSATLATSYATVDITGGTIGTLAAPTGGGAKYLLNGGIYTQKYESGTYYATTGDNNKTYTITVATGKDFKPYDGKYLLAEASAGTNMNIGKDLKVNLRAYKGSVDVASASYTLGDNDPITVTPTTETVDGKDCYVVTVPVAAKQMAEEIVVLFKDANGKVINVETDSIKVYGKRVLDDPDMSNAHTVIVDMLNYGAAAQKYFKYKTNALANEGITATGTDGAALLEAEKNNGDLYFAGSYAYHSANLTLDDQVDFNMYFWTGQIGEDKGYSYTVNGVEMSEDGAQFNQTLDGDLLYQVKIEGLSVADLATAKVAITFTDKDNVEKTITDSVFNYLVRNDGKSRLEQDGTDDSGLYAALMAFAGSASKYDPDGPTFTENGTPDA